MKAGNLIIHPLKREEPIDGTWADWSCTYQVGNDGDEKPGFIQGDGGLFESGTLTDEDGWPVDLMTGERLPRDDSR